MRERYHAFPEYRREMPLGLAAVGLHSGQMSPLHMLRTFETAILPVRCVFCGTRAHDDEGFVCADCLDDLPWQQTPLLPSAPGFERVMAPLAYEFPVDAAIKSFKFRRKLFYGPAFAQLLTRVSHELPDDIDAVLPVPLHWRRKWRRGFNQALEIARPMAKQLGLPVVRNVRRRRATRPQSGLSATQRASNLRAAFAVRGPLHQRHVLVVDDVVTTGSTLQHVAMALLAAGVSKVSGMAVARA
jgi:ComF family protein